MSMTRNPAKSRPLSRNVRRLMKMEREAPKNPNIVRVERKFTEKDIMYCEMQGEIFMAAIDKSVDMKTFAPMFMNSQLAGVIDYSFSCAKGMENDEISELLKVPLLLKSPDVIVDVTLWLNNIVSGLDEQNQTNAAVMSACFADTPMKPSEEEMLSNIDINTLADDYEYAYWLGYIYRYECLLHEESSRMVYGAFSEEFLRDIYVKHFDIDNDTVTLSECAGEICRRLDELLIGKLWKNK